MREENRLRSREEFRRVFQKGVSVANREIVVYVWNRGDGGPWRAGFSVSKKVGGAVVRNKVKRRLREAVRGQGERLPAGWDLVVIARPGCDAASFEQLYRGVSDLVEKAVRRGGQRGNRRSPAPRKGKGRSSKKG